MLTFKVSSPYLGSIDLRITPLTLAALVLTSAIFASWWFTLILVGCIAVVAAVEK